MTCSHCTNTITNTLKGFISLDPTSILVSLDQEQATTVTNGSITKQELKQVIEDLGYDVGEIQYETNPQHTDSISSGIKTVVFSLSGMTCQHCVRTVSETLGNLPGVIANTVSVSLDKRQGTFSFEGSFIDGAKIKEIVENLGYDLNGIPRFSDGALPNALDSTLFASQAIPIAFDNPYDGSRRKVVMRVLGMTCHSCIDSITDVLKNEIPDVEPNSIHISLEAEMAMFICKNPDISVIQNAIEERGFGIENVQIIHNLIPPAVLIAIEPLTRQDSVASLGAVSVRSQFISIPSKVTFQISGMTCSSCVRTIERGLIKLPGVDPTSVQVNLLTHTGTFTAVGDMLDEKTIIQAIKNMGYSAGKVVFHSSIPAQQETSQSITACRADLVIIGMYCPNCLEKVHDALIKLHGIDNKSIRVDLDSGRTSFEFVGEFITRQRIFQSILQLGLTAESIKITKFTKKVMDSDNISISSQKSNRLVTTQLVVTGMTCSSCVANIERTMMKQPGVVSCQVNLLSKSAVIEHDPNVVGARSIAQMIEQIGYKAELAQDTQGNTISEQRASMQEALDKELALLKFRFLWSLLFAIPVILIHMIFMLALPSSNPVHKAFMKEITHGLTIGDLILFLLATPVQFWLGLPFYTKAYKSLVYTRTANMETLVALGTSVAYFASVGTVIAAMANHDMEAMGMNYFETAVLLITFIHFGKWLEAMAKGKTAETITKLMDLQPETATLVEISKNPRTSIDKNSLSTGETAIEEEILKEREIASEDIQVGDILKVNAGGRIPCDGKIWRGSTATDESMITGESVPVNKSEGDSVITATINLSAPIYIRAIRVGSDTTLSRIIQLVQDAQASPKAPIEQVADNISAVFVPIVILLAITTFIIWLVLGIKDMYPHDWLPMGQTKTVFAIMTAVTVLVIACPCGLGLASPTAVMVGTGVAAKYGVLVKGGGYALEMSSRITTVAFDKTGTLTMGKPTVTHSWIDKSTREDQSDVNQRISTWKILGRVSSVSNHPLSKSIDKKARYIISSLTENPNLTDAELFVNELDENDQGEEEELSEDSNLFDGVTITNAQEVPGRGLLATITVSKEIADTLAGKLRNVRALNVFLGNQAWMDENHARYQTSRQAKEGQDLINQWQDLGQSIVLVSASPVSGNDEVPTSESLHKEGCKDACACAVCHCTTSSICCSASKTMMISQLAIADIPRPEAKLLIEELKRRNIEVWMITGDNERTGRVVGKQLGIPEDFVLAGVKPEQKADKIRNLQKRGIRSQEHQGKQKFWKRNGKKHQDAVVAMVGDGINDSPALAQADVGISVGSATDIAIEAASIVLIRNNLMDLLTMYDVSSTVVRRIRFNFVWAFAYNVIAMPIAAGILYPATGEGLPTYLAGVAMVLSSISVVCSSLLLRLYRPPKIVKDSHRIKL
ncbi:E1-E2 ATPase-domain-containing protein [Thamnidium elegans]|nr:E1-E2 ATPase-domain-containing protein [Thamnidium elegans]